MSKYELPFNHAVSLSLTSSAKLDKFGYNAAVGVTEETVWTQGGVYSYLAAASVLKISSSSVADAVAGTGALTVQIYGLDANYAEINETITLTGQTAVNSTNSYLRIFRMVVRSAGSGGANAGVIYAGTGAVVLGVPANIYAEIAIGENQTLMSLYTVPAGKKLVVNLLFFASDVNDLTVRFVARPFGEVFQVKRRFIAFQTTNEINFPVAAIFDEKTDLEIRATAKASSTQCSAGFNGYLVSRY